MPPDDGEITDATTHSAVATSSTSPPMTDEMLAESEQRNNEATDRSGENKARSFGAKSRENIILSDEGVYSFLIS